MIHGSAWPREPRRTGTPSDTPCEPIAAVVRRRSVLKGRCRAWGSPRCPLRAWMISARLSAPSPCDVKQTFVRTRLETRNPEKIRALLFACDRHDPQSRPVVFWKGEINAPTAPRPPSPRLNARKPYPNQVKLCIHALQGGVSRIHQLRPLATATRVSHRLRQDASTYRLVAAMKFAVRGIFPGNYDRCMKFLGPFPTAHSGRLVPSAHFRNATT